MDRALLVKNIVSTMKLARVFDLPIVHSTVRAALGTMARRAWATPFSEQS